MGSRAHALRTGLLSLIASAAVALALVAAGCNDDDASSGDGSSTADPVKIGFMLGSLEIKYELLLRDGARQADKAPDVEVDIDAPASFADVETQIAKTEAMITRGIDALAIQVDDAQALQPVLKRAASQDIPVILFDVDIADFEEKTAYVGTDNFKGGQIAGRYIKQQLDGEGEVGLLAGNPGDPSVADRLKGARDALKGSDIEVAAELRTDCLRDKGQNAAEDLITGNPQLAAIFAGCGEPSIAAVSALEAAGKLSDVLLVGFDATEGELKNIRAGKQAAAVVQFPDRMGQMAVEVAVKAARGQTVPKNVDTGTDLVTQDNVDEFEAQ